MNIQRDSFMEEFSSIFPAEAGAARIMRTRNRPSREGGSGFCVPSLPVRSRPSYRSSYRSAEMRPCHHAYLIRWLSMDEIMMQERARIVCGGVIALCPRAGKGGCRCLPVPVVPGEMMTVFRRDRSGPIFVALPCPRLYLLPHPTLERERRLPYPRTYPTLPITHRHRVVTKVGPCGGGTWRSRERT